MRDVELSLSLAGQSQENIKNWGGGVGCGASCRCEDTTDARLGMWPMSSSDDDSAREEADSEGTLVTTRNSGAARVKVSTAKKGRI